MREMRERWETERERLDFYRHGKNSVQSATHAAGRASDRLAYGNGVFGQMPTGILMYVTMVFMFLSPKIERVKQIKINALKK